MTYNPYQYDPSEDNDLFSDDNEASESFEKRSANNDPYSNIVEELISSGEISREDAHRFKNLIEAITPNDSLRVVSGFLEYDMRGQSFREESSMMRAMMHALDELTEGRVINLWRVFEVERMASETKLSMDSIDLFVSKICDKPDHEEEIAALSFLSDYLSSRMENLHIKYNQLIEQTPNYSPDYSVFESGKKNDKTPSWVNRIMFWRRVPSPSN